MRQLLKTLLINLKYKKRNVRIKSSSRIGWNSQFEGNNRIGAHCIFTGYMGCGSYMGSNCQITATIGKYCSLGNFIHVARGRHPAHDWVSTHPAFYSTGKQAGVTFSKTSRFEENVYADPIKKTSVIVENDVWIGDNVLLMAGVTVKNGAIIAAGAVVTKDVEPYSIVAGVPAKVIGYRFDKEYARMVEKTEWWNKDADWLVQNSDLFCDIKVFVEQIPKCMEAEANESM